MNRRQLLTRIVAGFSAIAAVAFTYPFLRSWIPRGVEDVLLDIPLDDLRDGRPKLVRWLGRNVFIIRRSDESQHEVERGEPTRLDPDSLTSNQPEFATNTFRSRKKELFVAYTNCTHLGCEVQARFSREDDLLGFSCPCHQSEFDAAGRVASDAAAKHNLEIPYYEYLPDDIIRFRKRDENEQSA